MNRKIFQQNDYSIHGLLTGMTFDSHQNYYPTSYYLVQSLLLIQLVY